ncbi:DUF5723 family protein [Tellurirhabdus bombi]|uniref:DUF5723 family protein n=1 Tax=Tellurirhabdus bombi TaxID=2907205 RepID=UPI001F26936A|nr:DUF5723 family protein [Tellurirhabdus bombi]
MIRQAASICLVFLFSLPVVAQNMLGVSTSPYGGTHSLYINPAFAATSPHSFYLNVAAVNAHVSNNYVRYQAPFSLWQLALGRVPREYQRPDGSVQFKTDYTGEILNDQLKSGTAWVEVRGPSALIKFGQGAAVGLTTRLRSAAQFRNASEQLLSLVRAGLEDETLYNIPSRDNQFSATTNTYAEIGLTLAIPILQDDYQQLSIGATVKRLKGLTSGFLINNGLSYRLRIDEVNPNSVYLQAESLNAELGYTTYLQEKGRSVTLRQLFDANNPGQGWGADLGLSYQLMADDNPSKHMLRLGVALNDLGNIQYKSQQYVQRYSINQTNRRFSQQDFDEVNGSEDAAQVIRNKLELTDADNQRQFTSGLPTTLSINADVRMSEGLYLSGTLLSNLRSKDAIAMYQPTLLAITPRLETPTLGISIPLLYLNQAFMAGVSMRLGPVFIGSDNLIGLIGSTSNNLRPRGADIYAGFSFAGLRRNP